jgi:hypothetical protein
MEKMTIPEQLVAPLPEFAADFTRYAEMGQQLAALSDVVFVGLARNCADQLKANLDRLEVLAASFQKWKLYVVTNDNTDGTSDVLNEFVGRHENAEYQDSRLDREHFSSEFAGRRTEALAEYRTECQQWVQENARDSHYVIAIDFDAWGGWSHAGVLHGIGALASAHTAYGMASVSLAQYPQLGMKEDQQPFVAPAWVHYDAWALRLNSYRDDYTAGEGGWKHQWVPAIGSPPVKVCSAFGGLAIYRTAAYLAGTYSGEDCEHVPFHRTMQMRTGQHLFLNPSMRTVMSWMESDKDGREHGNDLPADVSH